MPVYSFKIVADGLNPQDCCLEDRFFEVGCNDATISTHHGKLFFDFDREAETDAAAIISAVNAVARAGARIVAVWR